MLKEGAHYEALEEHVSWHILIRETLQLDSIFSLFNHCLGRVFKFNILPFRSDGGEDLKVVKSKDDLGIGKVYEKDKGESHFKIHFKIMFSLQKIALDPQAISYGKE